MEQEKSLYDVLLDVYSEKVKKSRPPEKLKSNWPFNDFQQPRKPIPVKLFIDCAKTGETMAEFDDLQKALQFINKSKNFVLRPYTPSLEDRDKENAMVREQKLLGLIEY